MRANIIRYLVELDFSTLTDTNRHELVTGIQQAAPTSQLFTNSAAIQATVASVVKADGSLKQFNDAVTQDKVKLKNDTTQETTARGTLDGEVRTLVTLTQAVAKSPADVIAMGLPYRQPVVFKKLPPAAPETINTTTPKKGHGKAKVTVYETPGQTRGEYDAEWSPDPVGANTWAPLGVGHGKSREVTGASGTKVWVRFARVRGQVRGEWSTPILVTIP